ncbi:MAG: hypothetical protein ACOYL6_13235 [Bacteriovoracaceae bacterium]
MVKYLVPLFFLSLLLVGCEPIRKAKMYTRHYILGKPLEEPTPEVTAVPEVKDYKKEGEAIALITPQKKVYNLINGFLTTPETSIKNLLVAEFQRASFTFKNDDSELISSLTKFAPLIQDTNADAMDIVIAAYINLQGANQEAAAYILATGLDYMLPKTLELYFSKKKENFCAFAHMVDKHFEIEQKISIFKERREALAEYHANTTHPENLRAYAVECDKDIQLELVRMNLVKKQVIEEQPMPENSEEGQTPIAPAVAPVTSPKVP